MVKDHKADIHEEAIKATPYGIVQYLDQHEDAPAKFEEMKEYMDTIIFTDPTYAKVKDECKLREAACTTWALNGDCEDVSRCTFIVMSHDYLLAFLQLAHQLVILLLCT
jgi:hypothetical protein